MIYIENNKIALIPYTHGDDLDMYSCWQDKGTQKGYNCIFALNFKEFSEVNISVFPFWCTIVDKDSNVRLGSLRLGFDPVEPDLAIWIYPLYRGKGIGTSAFALALDYIFQKLSYDTISAGCYEDNTVSYRMLTKLGFIRVPQEDITETNCFTGAPIRQLVLKLSRMQWEHQEKGTFHT